MACNRHYGKLTSMEAEFQSDIRAAIPTLIEILSHSDKSIQIDALKGIAVLGVHSKWCIDGATAD